MAFREVRVFEVRDQLRVWLAGEGVRSIERLVGVDRKTVRRYVGAAESLGLVRDGSEEQLTDALVGMVVEAVRPHRTDGHGGSWRLLAANHDQIAEWVGADLTAVKIHELLGRRGVMVPCRTVQRYVLEVCGRSRGRGPTVRGPTASRAIGRRGCRRPLVPSSASTTSVTSPGTSSDARHLACAIVGRQPLGAVSRAGCPDRVHQFLDPRDDRDHAQPGLGPGPGRLPLTDSQHRGSAADLLAVVAALDHEIDERQHAAAQLFVEGDLRRGAVDALHLEDAVDNGLQMVVGVGHHAAVQVTWPRDRIDLDHLGDLAQVLGHVLELALGDLEADEGQHLVAHRSQVQVKPADDAPL